MNDSTMYDFTNCPFLEELSKKDPGRNMVFTAIETLKTSKDIKLFFDEYVQFLKDNGSEPKIREDARRVAESNIGYILGYYGGDEHALWYGVLQTVSHPIFGHDFGRGYTPTVEEALEAGKKACRTAKKVTKSRSPRKPRK